MMLDRRRLAAMTALCIVLCAVPSAARADEDARAAAVAALKQQDSARAVTLFEGLADEGTLDAAMSFNRGLAYALRARTQPQPGDLGRAAHAFEEARSLTYDATLRNDAETALAQVRSEIARERGRSGASPAMQPAPPILRSVASSIPEDAWALLCLLGSAGLCAALLFVGAASRNARVASRLAASVCLAMLLGGGLFLFVDRSARRDLTSGVIITKEVRPADDRHVPLPAEPPVPEGTRLDILGSAAGWTQVRLASGPAWISADAILPIGK
jgi:hypothetical protein